ncbi:TetR/AcrR family transcriptional regulator C-terminal domain-containing protein [Amycolatopsis taiwanensis]|uniref:Transcriptional regulator, TetR family n=1 Tax=Amycolatopsis taiwanensis TaxID=342230 RepID=A0A9W6QZS6_9PSEU|nr:TetR/AcrR family transcriptional regulator C-terminal domain-containing protein [Amycolatopsis taiwanensis]GLY66693.1 putative transcriptional regulator, TetR family [Amycolatopsis taiwanensis]
MPKPNSGVTPATEKITADTIASAALDLLNETGLDGLTMRRVGERLGVRAAALYWHIKNKQQLLDAMATIMFTEAVDGLEAPRRGVTWQDWASHWAGQLRRTMLRYRDGARVFAGTDITSPVMYRIIELTLRTLQDAGFTLRDAARGFPALLHYTVGFTIEEQARTGLAYGDDSPYQPDPMAETIDAARFPLTAEARGDLFDLDTDANFEHGLRVILAGLEHTHLNPHS